MSTYNPPPPTRPPPGDEWGGTNLPDPSLGDDWGLPLPSLGDGWGLADPSTWNLDTSGDSPEAEGEVSSDDDYQSANDEYMDTEESGHEEVEKEEDMTQLVRSASRMNVGQMASVPARTMGAFASNSSSNDHLIYSPGQLINVCQTSTPGLYTGSYDADNVNYEGLIYASEFELVSQAQSTNLQGSMWRPAPGQLDWSEDTSDMEQDVVVPEGDKNTPFTAPKQVVQPPSQKKTTGKRELQSLYHDGFLAVKKQKLEEAAAAKAVKAAESAKQAADTSAAAPVAPWVDATSQPLETQGPGQSTDPTPAESTNISAKAQGKQPEKAQGKQPEKGPFDTEFQKLWIEDQDYRTHVGELRNAQKEAAKETVVGAPDGRTLPIGSVRAMTAKLRSCIPVVSQDGFARLIRSGNKRALPLETGTLAKDPNMYNLLGRLDNVLGELGDLDEQNVTAAAASQATVPVEQNSHAAPTEEFSVETVSEPGKKLFQIQKPRRMQIRDIAAEVKAEAQEKARKAAQDMEKAISAQAGRIQGQAMDIDKDGSVKGTEHPTKLTEIQPWQISGCDVLLEYRKFPEPGLETAWAQVGGIDRTLELDNTFKVAVDGGKLGTPRLNFALNTSLNPKEHIQTAAAVKTEFGAGRSVITTLRFPTGDFRKREESLSRYSIDNLQYQKLSRTSPLWQHAQKGRKQGAKPADVIEMTWDSHGNFLDDYEDSFPTITNAYSERLRQIYTHLRLIHNMNESMQYRCSFIYRGPLETFIGNSVVPLQQAVSHHLPQYFPFYNAKTASPIAGPDQELVTEVGQRMHMKDGKLVVYQYPSVKKMDNLAHYLVCTSMGAVRAQQFDAAEGKMLALGQHRIHILKPSLTSGDRNWKIYVKMNETQKPDGTWTKPLVPAEGTHLQINQLTLLEAGKKLWAGNVARVTLNQLNRPQFDTDFDFLIDCNSPKGCHFQQDAICDSYSDMAMHLQEKSLAVKLRVPYASGLTQRGLDALKYLESHTSNDVVDIILGRYQPEEAGATLLQKKDKNGVKFEDTMNYLMKEIWKLDPSQGRAIRRALTHRLTLIQGPTGTGKTFAVACLILLSIIAGQRALACASNNNAVDEIIRKLKVTMPHELYPSLKKYPIVRAHLSGVEFGRLIERVSEEAELLLNASAELATAEVLDPDETEIAFKPARKSSHFVLQEFSLAQAVIDLAKQDEQIFGRQEDQDDVCKQFRLILEAYRKANSQNRHISVEDSRIFAVQYQIMIRRVLNNTSIVLTTCNNAGSDYLLQGYSPDIVLMDDAAQSPEIDTIIPLACFKAARWVLCGDHKQLAPICPSARAKEWTKQRVYSAFERFMNLGYSTMMLDVNYRFTKKIMGFLAQEYYPDLTYQGCVENHGLLQSMRQWAWASYKKNTECLFIGVINGVAEQVEDYKSLVNVPEAHLVVRIIDSMLWKMIDPQQGVVPPIRPEDIGVIVSYQSQAKLILKFLVECAGARSIPYNQWRKIEVATVDSFQGREKNIVISSFIGTNVPSLDGHALSEFIVDDRRLGATLSRARYGSVILGNGQALLEARPVVSGAPVPKLSKLVPYHKVADSYVQDDIADLSEQGQIIMAHRNAQRARIAAAAAAHLRADMPEGSVSGTQEIHWIVRGRGGRGRGTRGHPGDIRGRARGEARDSHRGGQSAPRGTRGGTTRVVFRSHGVGSWGQQGVDVRTAAAGDIRRRELDST